MAHVSIELAPNNAYGLSLQTPVMAAAGCFGYAIEYARMVDLARMGAIVTRSTSMRGRSSRHPPRLIETPAGVLCVGAWPERGLAYVLRQYAPVWAAWNTPVILSITGDSAADYAQIGAALEGIEGVAGLELNMLEQADRAAAITTATRAATLLPLLVKLPPNETGLAELARAVATAGADALTICGPPAGMAINPRTGEKHTGRLSGPALRPLTLRLVAEVATSVTIPVIACGGIASADDARQFLAAGATAVQVGAALLADPFAVITIAEAL